MKLILVATRSGKEFYIKTDLDTDLALLRFKLETNETVRHFNDDYCGDVTDDTHYDFLYLSTEVINDEPENNYDDEYYAELEAPEWDDEPIVCKCCGGSGYL